jgi:hypothetical protein
MKRFQLTIIHFVHEPWSAQAQQHKPESNLLIFNVGFTEARRKTVTTTCTEIRSR